MRSCALRPLSLRPIIATHSKYCRTSSSLSSETAAAAPPSQLDKLKERLVQTWDEHSGQRELEHLKRSVQQASMNFDVTVGDVVTFRSSVEDAQRAHDDAQKQLASLMMRREQWDGTDAALFVEYTSKEVKTRQALAEARNSLRKAEEDSSRCQREYMDVMRQRYHEEQMWQEKWRMLGTFGTWTLIGLNSFLFLGSQFFHQRREINRLKAIEQLIKDNLQTMQDTVSSGQAEQIAIAEAAADSANKAMTANVEALAKQSERADKQKIVSNQPSREPVDWMMLIRNRDLKSVAAELGASAQETMKGVHGPSVALGAAASTTLVVIVMLLTSKR